jgi:hypothetical protein
LCIRYCVSDIAYPISRVLKDDGSRFEWLLRGDFREI